jgi:hypothetical protein
VSLPVDIRKVLEKMNTRVVQLENQVRRLQDKEKAAAAPKPA